MCGVCKKWNDGKLVMSKSSEHGILIYADCYNWNMSKGQKPRDCRNLCEQARMFPFRFGATTVKEWPPILSVNFRTTMVFSFTPPHQNFTLMPVLIYLDRFCSDARIHEKSYEASHTTESISHFGFNNIRLILDINRSASSTLIKRSSFVSRAFWTSKRLAEMWSLLVRDIHCESHLYRYDEEYSHK